MSRLEKLFLLKDSLLLKDLLLLKNLFASSGRGRAEKGLVDDSVA